MRHLWVAVLAALLLSLAAAAHADATTDALKATVDTLQKQLTDALDRIKALEAGKAAAPATQPTTAPAVKPAPKWYDTMKIGGYWHARYEDRRMMMPGNSPPAAFVPGAATRNRDEFLLRRLYLNISAQVNDRTSATVMLRRLGTANQFIDLEALFVNYALDDLWGLEFGRVYNKFGWDAWESSSKRLPFDRFAGVEGYGPAGVRGLYFGGPTDQGLYLSRKSDGRWVPNAYLGFVNGNFINPENDNHKTISLDLRWKQGDIQFGASALKGKYTEALGTPPVAMTTDREMVGLFVHTDPNPWGFQGELITGELFGQDVRGFYTQVARKFSNGTGYARFEQYNPSDDIAGDLYNAWKFGYAWQLDKNSELTFEYMSADRGEVPVGQWGVQWQFGL